MNQIKQSRKNVTIATTTKNNESKNRTKITKNEATT